MSALRAKKSPHCGWFEETPAHLMAGFHLQTFFASVKVPFGRYWFPISPFFLCPKSGQIRSKLPCPATTPLAPQSGTQGQTGRKKKAKPFGSPTLAYFYSIFRIWQSHLWQMFALKTSFFSLPKIGANSLQTALPCNYSTYSAKRYTGANRAQKKRTF